MVMFYEHLTVNRRATTTENQTKQRNEMQVVCQNSREIAAMALKVAIFLLEKVKAM